MNDHLETEVDRLSHATIAAMNGLPILVQLEFVRNILSGSGGNKDCLPKDAVLITATELLNGVIEVVKQHPRLARLRDFPEP